MPNCEPYDNAFAQYLDGALSDDARREFLAHAERCPACREHLAWTEQLRYELGQIADEEANKLPPIDVTADVIARIRTATHATAPEPMSNPRRRSPMIWPWITAAAAVCLVVLGWWLYDAVLDRAPDMAQPARVARVFSTESPHSQSESPNSAESETPSSHEASGDRADLLLDRARPNRHERPALDGFSQEQVTSARLTLENILNARREGVTDDGALDRLRAWAMLSPEEARALLFAPGTDAEALLGAASFLSPEEAEAAARQATAASPDDPYAHLLLAKALQSQPGKEDEAAAEFEKAAQLDPENALPQYMQAAGAFGEQHVDEGLQLLATAQEKSKVSAYALKGAVCREQALVESGKTDNTTARVLAALTSGMEEYVALWELGAQLLGLGQEFEAAGDLATAQQLYESTNALGLQVAEDSATSTEQLAGVDIQRAAVDYLESVYTAQEDEEGLAWLQAQVDSLASQIEEIVAFLDTLNQIFLGELSQDALLDIADRIFQFGDLLLFGSP
ncbi:MAG TPA: anti-sigma factor [Candidatus Hydrogenedentes bacterium]|nr:anti-sigma factor [Candidatus Hydrogenedentota bacterium]HPG67684.1 anti-sigma factor [Candidatus Hydrogenedentota bacterium]